MSYNPFDQPLPTSGSKSSSYNPFDQKIDQRGSSNPFAAFPASVPVTNPVRGSPQSYNPFDTVSKVPVSPRNGSSNLLSPTRGNSVSPERTRTATSENKQETKPVESSRTDIKKQATNNVSRTRGNEPSVGDKNGDISSSGRTRSELNSRSGNDKFDLTRSDRSNATQNSRSGSGNERTADRNGLTRANTDRGARTSDNKFSSNNNDKSVPRQNYSRTGQNVKATAPTTTPSTTVTTSRVTPIETSLPKLTQTTPSATKMSKSELLLDDSEFEQEGEHEHEQITRNNVRFSYPPVNTQQKSPILSPPISRSTVKNNPTKTPDNTTMLVNLNDADLTTIDIDQLLADSLRNAALKELGIQTESKKDTKKEVPALPNGNVESNKLIKHQQKQIENMFGGGDKVENWLSALSVPSSSTDITSPAGISSPNTGMPTITATYTTTTTASKALSTTATPTSIATTNTVATATNVSPTGASSTTAGQPKTSNISKSTSATTTSKTLSTTATPTTTNANTPKVTPIETRLPKASSAPVSPLISPTPLFTTSSPTPNLSATLTPTTHTTPSTATSNITTTQTSYASPSSSTPINKSASPGISSTSSPGSSPSVTPTITPTLTPRFSDDFNVEEEVLLQISQHRRLDDTGEESETEAEKSDEESKAKFISKNSSQNIPLNMESLHLDSSGALEYSNNYPTSVVSPIENDEVIIRVEACLISSDLQLFTSRNFTNFVSTPCNLGREVCGEIVKCGPDVFGSGFNIGQKVITMMPLLMQNNKTHQQKPIAGSPGNKLSQGTTCSGGSSTFIRQKYSLLLKKPSNVGPIESTFITNIGCRAYDILHYKCKVRRGDSLLVLNGAKPSGIILLQLASLCNIKIITTVNTLQEKTFLMKYNNIIDRIIDLQKENFYDAIIEETGGIGVDYIVENQEKPEFDFPAPFEIALGLGAHGVWVTSRNIQVDPPLSELLQLKGCSISFVKNTQSWNMFPSQQGRLMHIMADLMSAIEHQRLVIPQTQIFYNTNNTTTNNNGEPHNHYDIYFYTFSEAKQLSTEILCASPNVVVGPSLSATL